MDSFASFEYGSSSHPNEVPLIDTGGDLPLHTTISNSNSKEEPQGAHGPRDEFFARLDTMSGKIGAGPLEVQECIQQESRRVSGQLFSDTTIDSVFGVDESVFDDFHRARTALYDGGQKSYAASIALQRHEDSPSVICRQEVRQVQHSIHERITRPEKFGGYSTKLLSPHNRESFAKIGVKNMVERALQAYANLASPSWNIPDVPNNTRSKEERMIDILTSSIQKGEELVSDAREWLYFDCYASPEELEWMESYGLKALESAIYGMQERIEMIKNPPIPAKRNLFSRIGSWFTGGRNARKARQREQRLEGADLGIAA